MKKSLLPLSAALCSSLAWADPQAINLAGRQRMLSQRRVKAYMLRQWGLEGSALQWEWLRTALATEGAASFRFIVAASSEAILELTDQATQQAPGPSQR